MKVWIKSFLLVITLAVYIMLGSLVFVHIEGGEQPESQREILQYLQNFTRNHSECGVDLEVMKSLLTKIDEARLHRAFVTSADPDTPIKEVWSIQNALVLCYTIVTTMGFGWIVPRTFGGQLFCIAFAIPGIALQAYMLSVIGRTFQKVCKKCSDLFVRGVVFIKSRRARKVIGVLVLASALWAFMIILPGVIYIHTENWSLLTAQYFNFVAFTTIGFGDITPTHAAVPPHQRNGVTEMMYRVGMMTFLFVGMAINSIVLTAVWRYHKRKMGRAMESTRLMLISRGLMRDTSHKDENNEAFALDEDPQDAEETADQVSTMNGSSARDNFDGPVVVLESRHSLPEIIPSEAS